MAGSETTAAQAGEEAQVIPIWFH